MQAIRDVAAGHSDSRWLLFSFALPASAQSFDIPIDDRIAGPTSKPRNKKDSYDNCK
jgi:hypothetical protein